jgi:hypothetical protein
MFKNSSFLVAALSMVGTVAFARGKGDPQLAAIYSLVNDQDMREVSDPPPVANFGPVFYFHGSDDVPSVMRTKKAVLDCVKKQYQVFKGISQMKRFQALKEQFAGMKSPISEADFYMNNQGSPYSSPTDLKMYFDASHFKDLPNAKMKGGVLQIINGRLSSITPSVLEVLPHLEVNSSGKVSCVTVSADEIISAISKRKESLENDLKSLGNGDNDETNLKASHQ